MRKVVSGFAAVARAQRHHALSVRKRCFKRFRDLLDMRRFERAQIIQCFWRVTAAKTELVRRKREAHALRIRRIKRVQGRVRYFLFRKYAKKCVRLVTMVQVAFRRFKEAKAAAICIQRHYRGSVARQVVAVLRNHGSMRTFPRPFEGELFDPELADRKFAMSVDLNGTLHHGPLVTPIARTHALKGFRGTPLRSLMEADVLESRRKSAKLRTLRPLKPDRVQRVPGRLRLRWRGAPRIPLSQSASSAQGDVDPSSTLSNRPLDLARATSPLLHPPPPRSPRHAPLSPPPPPPPIEEMAEKSKLSTLPSVKLSKKGNALIASMKKEESQDLSKIDEPFEGEELVLPLLSGHQQKRKTKAKRAKRKRKTQRKYGEHSSILCTVCFERPRSVLLLPCRHCATCEVCEAKLGACVACRAVPRFKIPMFLP